MQILKVASPCIRVDRPRCSVLVSLGVCPHANEAIAVASAIHGRGFALCSDAQAGWLSMKKMFTRYSRSSHSNIIVPLVCNCGEGINSWKMQMYILPTQGIYDTNRPARMQPRSDRPWVGLHYYVRIQLRRHPPASIVDNSIDNSYRNRPEELGDCQLGFFVKWKDKQMLRK
jgi:hypothetical protein